MNKIAVILLFGIFCVQLVAQDTNSQITINTKKGHSIKTGSSGFNVRIADKVWNYTHPDFRTAVHELKPGWLRYFSGTMGDAFNSATGQYDLDYTMMFDKSEQYLIGHKFTEIKGPHRISDLYQLLGEINGKLIVTVNAFSETPEVTRELARFIKNNNIKVALWQFCNEPYFYVPHRQRFWWNDGYDYAVKMKPHAEAILEEFPNANLALNFTWDGIWAFMKEIHRYQEEKGAYWNTFSKHSYAPHVGKKESQQDAYRRGNTKLLEATGKEAMAEIEAYTKKGIPMSITEFGVWNRPLNGIYSSIYNIEYVMRQLQHPNTEFVGAHEVSNKYIPAKNLGYLITQAFAEGKLLNTDSIRTGVEKTLEGKAFEIFHDVTNHVDRVYETQMDYGFMVQGMKNTELVGAFAQAYHGINGYNYLVVTNRSKYTKQFDVIMDGQSLISDIETTFITASDITVRNTEIQKNIEKNAQLTIHPFSVTVAKWKSDNANTLAQPRIYNLAATINGIEATWGPIENATGYRLQYGELGKPLDRELRTKLGTSKLVTGLDEGKTYTFALKSSNENGESISSDSLSITMTVPDEPEIFKTARRDDSVTIMWRSVPFANGYTLKYVSENGNAILVDTKNVFGYRVEGLKNNEPYLFSIAAYNGLGQSEFSVPVSITPQRNIPFSPRDVSAREMEIGSILLNWVPQKNNPIGTSYIVLRGEKLHEFEVLKKGITNSFFEDSDIEVGKDYYYTVKAETLAGESNFYPNIATPIKRSHKHTLNVETIEKQDNGDYIITVNFKNIPLDGDYSLGIIYNNISYLTVEENRLTAIVSDKNMGSYQVILPSQNLRKKSKYAIKAFVNTNGKDIFSDTIDDIIIIE